jgi:hypothetical protein
MLGHLVSVSRQSPPDFGIKSLLRAVARAFPATGQRLIALVCEAAHHARKPSAIKP